MLYGFPSLQSSGELEMVDLTEARATADAVHTPSISRLAALTALLLIRQ